MDISVPQLAYGTPVYRGLWNDRIPAAEIIVEGIRRTQRSQDDLVTFGVEEGLIRRIQCYRCDERAILINYHRAVRQRLRPELVALHNFKIPESPMVF